jgi:hypothetical protein
MAELPRDEVEEFLRLRGRGERLFTVGQTLRALKCSYSTLDVLCLNGRIDYTRNPIGHRLFWTLEIDRVLDTPKKSKVVSHE